MLRNFAHVISVIFHPLLVVTYVLILLLLVNPYLFGVNSVAGRIPLILQIFFTTFAIPFFAVIMMKNLELVSSYDLKERTDRIGPYIVAGVFYTWIFRMLLSNTDIPLLFKIFVLGATIALFICFFINLFSKISAHSAGMGGLVGMVILMIAYIGYPSFPLSLGGMVIQVSLNTLLMLVLILAGLVGTARLILDAHEIRDLVGGFLVGLSAQFFALYFLAS